MTDIISDHIQTESPKLIGSPNHLEIDHYQYTGRQNEQHQSQIQSPRQQQQNKYSKDRLYRYRARRLRFLINGDKYFRGINYALNTEKIRSFDSLLNDLTAILSLDHLKLCKGVRFIFDSQGKLITALSEFQDGKTYICSSIESYTAADYGRNQNNANLNWLVRNSACISQNGRTNGYQINGAGGGSASGNVSRVSGPDRIEGGGAGGGAGSPGNINKMSPNNTNILNKTITTPNGRISSSKTNKTPKTSIKSTNNRQSIVRHKLDYNHQSKPQLQSQSQSQSLRQACKSPLVTPVKIPSPNKTIASSKNSGNDAILSEETSPPHRPTSFGVEVLSKYDIGSPIGDGHFSVVYCCMNKSNQDMCALKLIDKSKYRGRNEMMIYNEVKILKQLSHPNIVKLKEEFDYSDELYLILELVQDGDLFDAISSVTKFSEINVATMIHNLSSALTYLHKQGIVHRDIKPENLLISIHEDGSYSLKLADFGLAVEVDENQPLYSVCGTAFYVSPEMLTEFGYDYKVDVWSTGVICFILLCGYPPFTSTESDNDQDELFDAILAGDFQFAPRYWNHISQHAKDLIVCMLNTDPEKRYTAEQVFKHPWTMGLSNNFEGIEPMNMSRRIASM